MLSLAGLSLAVLALLGGCGSEPKELTPREHHANAIARACRYLWDHQSADGGWHSEEYGLLKSGQSLTPLVLSTLRTVPASVSPLDTRKTNAAANFIQRQLHKSGGLGLADVIQDYPNYATGLAIRALSKLPGLDAVVTRMRRYLLGQQFQESLGYSPKDPAFGGWGMGGEPRRAPNPGHMDLSMTRLVLEGLATQPSESGNTDAFSRARRFLARCQHDDGGFYFSPVKLGANKGGRDGEEFKSYGSTTADGILALLATRRTKDSKEVQRARAWLVAHHRVDQVPGIPADNPSNWHRGLRFYYLAAAAQAFGKLNVGEAPEGNDWRRELVTTLQETQRADGSWVNVVQTQKENDPLIATSLALQALVSAWRP